MAMQQCPNGHLYDDSKNKTCPYCGPKSSVNVTEPYGQPAGIRPTEGYDDPNYYPPTQPQDNSFPHTEPVDPVGGRTKPLDVTNIIGGGTVYIETGSIRPIRGWLVCVEGDAKGKDYRVCGDRNTIGRGPENDIVLDFDNTVSKGANAVISYDNRNNKFFIYFGEAKNNIYVNDQLLMVPIELKDYDVIDIGSSRLLFRSFCNERFNWEKQNAKAAE